MTSVVRLGARSKGGRKEPATETEALGRPRRAEEAALLKLLKGLSCRDYESCVEPATETFGLAASSLSRRFKRASTKRLAEFTERDLSQHDLVDRGLKFEAGLLCVIGGAKGLVSDSPPPDLLQLLRGTRRSRAVRD